jgi:acyl transferase domain-containing protein
MKVDIREVVFGSGGKEGEELEETRLVQPGLFAVEYALARTWMSWGVEPEAMIGHSLGEYVAACVAGVFSVEEGLRLVARRGRMMQELEGGAMIAVGVEESEAKALAGSELSVAAVNGPQQCVLSGRKEAVEEMERRLAGEGITWRRLKTSHAFHSGMMEPMLKEFEEEVKRVGLREPERRYVSNVTGSWMGKEEARSAEYWVKHVRQGVRFGEGVKELLGDPQRIFLEVGPGQTLVRAAKQQARGTPARIFLSSFATPEASDSLMIQTLGELWLAGAAIDWNKFHDGDRRGRVSLPTYPFERQRYWIEPERHVPETIVTYSSSAVAAAGSGDGYAVTVDVLPNGCDDSAPTPSLHERPQLKNAYVPPATDLEKSIAELCRRALGIKDVGIDDNFFELGGDSLTALRVAADVKAEYGIEIPVVSIYENLTIRELAVALSNGKPLEAKEETVDNRSERMARRRQHQRTELLKKGQS